MQVETLTATVLNNSNELEIYKQRYQVLESINQELQNKIIEIETNHKQNYQQLYNEYLTIKEQAD